MLLCVPMIRPGEGGKVGVGGRRIGQDEGKLMLVLDLLRCGMNVIILDVDAVFVNPSFAGYLAAPAAAGAHVVLPSGGLLPEGDNRVLADNGVHLDTTSVLEDFEFSCAFFRLSRLAILATQLVLELHWEHAYGVSVIQAMDLVFLGRTRGPLPGAALPALEEIQDLHTRGLLVSLLPNTVFLPKSATLLPSLYTKIPGKNLPLSHPDSPFALLWVTGGGGVGVGRTFASPLDALLARSPLYAPVFLRLHSMAG